MANRLGGTMERTTWWRKGGSHAVAFIAGFALAIQFAPRAAQFNSLLSAPARSSAKSEFDRAMQGVMVQMDASMCITPTGDADRDFARTMIPHHQGAVGMARLELLYGKDPRLRRLAQGIAVEQMQEI